MYKQELIRPEGYAAAFAAPAQAAPAPAVRNWQQKLLREPLTHFLLIGILIFVIAHAIEARSKRYSIEVTPADVTRIVNSYAQQYGSEPSRAQLATMVDNYIREEIYLREGLALGLDSNDEIVRRRVAQKYDFLQQDMATPREPNDAQLADYYAAHRTEFTVPAKRSFEQVYFAIDQRGEEAARRLAADALPRLARGESVRADEFPGPKVVSNLSADDTARLFGGKDFAGEVFRAAPGRWAGPFRSGFGWHLVRVTDDRPARPRSLTEASADVRATWIEQDRLARNAEAYRVLKARYNISRADQPQ